MRLLAITDRHLLPLPPNGGHAERTAALVRQVAAWARGGVHGVQLREKDLPADELRALSGALGAAMRAAAGAQTLPALYVNLGGLAAPAQRKALGWAPGVHVPWDQLAPLLASGAVGAPLSVSVHTVEQARLAREAGATLIVFGPVWEKPVWDLVWGPAAGVEGRPVPRERLPGVGLAALRDAVRAAAPVPVYALGGVHAQNAAECAAAGAAGIAGVRLFLSSEWKRLARREPAI